MYLYLSGKKSITLRVKLGLCASFTYYTIYTKIIYKLEQLVATYEEFLARNRNL